MKKQLTIFISLVLAMGMAFQISFYSIFADQNTVNDLTCVFKTYKTATLNWTKLKDESGNEINRLSVRVQQSTNNQDWKDSILCDSKKEEASKNILSDKEALTVIGLHENTAYKFRLVILEGTSTVYSNEISVVTAIKSDSSKIIEFPDGEFQKAISQSMNKTDSKLNISDINELRYLNISADSINNATGIEYFQSLVHLNNFKTEAVDDKINLTWNNPINQGFSKVIIVRKQGSYPINLNDGEKVYEGKGTAYVDTDIDLSDEIHYYYRAFLYNNNGNVSIATLGNEANAKISSIVTKLKLSPETNKINLMWTNPTNDDFDHVEIYKSMQKITSINESGSCVYSGTEQSYIDKAVEKGHIYYYWIVNINKNGEKAKSIIFNQNYNYTSLDKILEKITKVEATYNLNRGDWIPCPYPPENYTGYVALVLDRNYVDNIREVIAKSDNIMHRGMNSHFMQWGEVFDINGKLVASQGTPIDSMLFIQQYRVENGNIVEELPLSTYKDGSIDVESVDTPNPIVEKQGSVIQMPKVNVHFGDESVKAIDVSWNPSSIDTSVKGTTTVMCSVPNYSQQIHFDITITTEVIAKIAKVEATYNLNRGDWIPCPYPPENYTGYVALVLDRNYVDNVREVIAKSDNIMHKGAGSDFAQWGEILDINGAIVGSQGTPINSMLFIQQYRVENGNVVEELPLE